MKTHRPAAEVSTSSMADIAFLLLTFFLVTTVIQNHKGILMMLPQFSQNPPNVPIPERNIFTIQINSADHLLVEGKTWETLAGLRLEIQEFILNHGRDKKSSDNPLEAVVSLKTDRGTTYKMFIATLDEIQAAYHEIYAKRVGITPEEFRKLNTNNPREAALYHRAKDGIPMNISMAEPTTSGH
ncbi:MAG: ExbD/TolR family protein [Flammeovirgaceae bacterium]